ncbi:FG-GAP repeat domain-containing protein [Mesoterricola sediminis]|uniref:VCBS repeat-containing protein n=1 Tax=Mesoterricola sediminis TaxID=2927980 RepID=A0AA48KBW1_9BACT|nr:VCBS repeat-containing protein [Mesoterricola sediminis]BDU76519.1 hypothetical protein METESE_14770 [Mesoterricola sediminis]
MAFPSLFPKRSLLVPGLGLLLLGCGGEDRVTVAGPYPVTSVAVADLDGDGRLDLVATLHGEGAPATQGWVTVRRQDPSAPGTYLEPELWAGGANPGRVVAAPLTAGGLPGLVILSVQTGYPASDTGAALVRFPDPAAPGGFLAPVALPLGGRTPRDAAVGDLTGDGRPDVVVAADGAATLLLFPQDAAGGTFGAPLALAVAGTPTAVAVADLDGDGLLDIAAATANDTVSILLQDAAHPGSFLPRVDLPAGSHPVALKVADLDKDGRPDLVVADEGTSAAQGVTVLLQAKAPAAAGTFLPPVGYAVGDAFAASVDAADLDGDGYPDLAVACAGVPGNPGSVAVLIQDQAHPGTFKAPVNYPGLQGPGSVALADVDGDGLRDLVIGDGYLYVRKQIAGQPGTFGLPLRYRQ